MKIYVIRNYMIRAFILYAMNMGNNLKELRKAAGLTQEQLGNLCDPPIPHVYISRYEKGVHEMKFDTAVRIAKALKVTVVDLLGHEALGFSESEVGHWKGEHDSGANIKRNPIYKIVSDPNQVPIVGYVGAGAQMYSYDDYTKGDGLAETDCPSGMNPAKTVAVEVVGDSMEPLISEGFLLFYEQRVFGVPDEYLSKICVVKVVDGPTLVKRVRKGSKVGLYKLICINPHENEIEVEIEWSAMVKTMVQR